MLKLIRWLLGRGPRGVFVVYVNVGALSVENVDSFIQKTKERFNENGFLDKMKRSNHEVVFMPNRTEYNTVEYIKL